MWMQASSHLSVTRTMVSNGRGRKGVEHSCGCLLKSEGDIRWMVCKNDSDKGATEDCFAADRDCELMSAVGNYQDTPPLTKPDDIKEKSKKRAILGSLGWSSSESKQISKFSISIREVVPVNVGWRNRMAIDQ